MVSWQMCPVLLVLSTYAVLALTLQMDVVVQSPGSRIAVGAKVVPGALETIAWVDGTPFFHTRLWNVPLSGHDCGFLWVEDMNLDMWSCTTTLTDLSYMCAIPRPNSSCASGPCNNGGTCVDNGNSYTCDCTGTGFTGPTCSVDIDECSTNNGGCGSNCLDMFRTPPTCTCAPGFTSTDGGATCVPGDCGCAHECVETLGEPTSCKCRDGYSTPDDGVTCVADDCTGSSPCQNGGRCTGSAPYAMCDCSGTGYTGPTCEEDVLECGYNNGGCAHFCTENVGAPPTCTCLPGYTTSDGGLTCDTSLCSGDFPHLINGKWCLKHVESRMSRGTAKNLCVGAGGGLLTIPNKATLEQAVTIMVRWVCALHHA